MDFLLSIVLVNFCIYPFKVLQNLCPCRYIPAHTGFKILFLCLKSIAYMDYIYFMYFIEFPRWLSGRESTCQCRRCRFDSWVGKIPWSRKCQPTPGFFAGKPHGQQNLAGYCPWVAESHTWMSEWVKWFTSKCLSQCLTETKHWVNTCPHSLSLSLFLWFLLLSWLSPGYLSG